MYAHTSHTLSTHGDQKGAMDPLELQLQMAVSSLRCTPLPRHLTSPTTWSSLSFTEVWKVYNKAIRWPDPSLAFFLVGFKTETKTEQQDGQEDELKSTGTF